MLHKQNTSVATLALLLVLAAAPKPVAATLNKDPVLAQSTTAAPAFTLPKSVKSGTNVRIDGSSSMAVVNLSLKQRFEKQYPGTKVDIGFRGSSNALKALQKGEIDLAAIGRPLTQKEKDLGLVALALPRNKIAVVVSPKNPFNGSLTDDQFAKIFRGQIKDWSKLGGRSGQIILVDRPTNSDTRQALKNYPVFKKRPFQATPTAIKLSQDTTSAVISKLGTNGIGYAISNQAINRPDVRVVLMHKTLTKDIRYPFSQPLYYVYNRKKPTPAALAFLGLATAPIGQQAINKVIGPPYAAAPGKTATPNKAATTPKKGGKAAAGAVATQKDASWLWLLLIPLLALLGIPLWLWLKSRRQPGAVSGDAQPTPPLAGIPDVTTPTTTNPADLAGGVAAGLPLITDRGEQSPGETPSETPSETTVIGPAATTAPREPEAANLSFLEQTEAETLTIPSDLIEGALAGGVLGAGAAAIPAIAGIMTDWGSTISLTPQDGQQALNRWQISEEHKLALQEQGGRKLILRLYDVTGIDPNTQTPSSFQQFPVTESTGEKLLFLPETNRDYITEIGYLTDDNRWLKLVRSDSVRIPSTVINGTVPPQLTPIPQGGTVSPPFDRGDLLPPEHSINTKVTWHSSIDLTPQGNQQALASWRVPVEHKHAVWQQGGRQLALRLYDVTDIDLNRQNPSLRGVSLGMSYQFDADEQANEMVLSIPAAQRDYMIELGYLTADDRWLMLVRSSSVRVVSVISSVSGNFTLPGTAVDIVPSATSTTLPLVSDEDSVQAELEGRKFDVGPGSTDLGIESLAGVDEGLPDLPEGYGTSRIVLMPRDPQWAYAYWDIPKQHREELRQQGGSKLALRFYDVTDVDLDAPEAGYRQRQNPHSVQEFECEEMARSWYLPVPVSDRDYIVEIGYVTWEGRWLLLACSNSIRIPPLYPSSWLHDQFLTIPWDEDLAHKQFIDLGSPSPSPSQQATALQSNGFHDPIFASVPNQETVSSYVFPSGVGMWASGVGMSGVGFSASIPPIRSRKFWLQADAELVVYGATEPDATITIGDRLIKANSDGTFRFQMSFQDGLLDYPIMAVASDGEQTRSVHLKFQRETPMRNANTKEEAQEEIFDVRDDE